MGSGTAMTTAMHKRPVNERRKLPGRGCTWLLSSASFSWLVKLLVSHQVFGTVLKCAVDDLKWIPLSSFTHSKHWNYGLSAGGYFAGSLAVMTDAAHLLVDFLSFIISLLSLWLSSRPATHKLNYGWHRAGTATFMSDFYKQFSCDMVKTLLSFSKLDKLLP